jgi:hypothetical protein
MEVATEKLAVMREQVVTGSQAVIGSQVAMEKQALPL